MGYKKYSTIGFFRTVRNEKGREKSKAGFVKVNVSAEKQVEVQDFVEMNRDLV